MKTATSTLAFIGGGNMARAIISGLRRDLGPGQSICVVEPHEPTASRLSQDLGVTVLDQASDLLRTADVVIWAIKPQSFHQVTTEVAPHVAPQALHLSVAAGIRCDSIARWMNTVRIVRAMPNTPALIGQGMTGLYASPAITQAERSVCEAIIAATGQFAWVTQESQLDAVTALSGSGPAYVFYVLEALATAGVALGLDPAQAHKLAVATFTGASALAAQSPDAPEVLRERVTSKGGTTHAAIAALDAAGTRQAFAAALSAAHQRAQELGDEFGAP